MLILGFRRLLYNNLLPLEVEDCCRVDAMQSASACEGGAADQCLDHRVLVMHSRRLQAGKCGFTLGRQNRFQLLPGETQLIVATVAIGGCG